jgi:hypothetical protein
MLPFYEFFAQAEERGIDLQVAADGLIRNIRLPSSAGKVHGVRRLHHWRIPSAAQRQLQHLAQDQCWKLAQRLEDDTELSKNEHAAIVTQLRALDPALKPFEGYVAVGRDPRLRPVPVSAWAGLSIVASDLTSYWPVRGVEDEDPDEEWTSVDWLAGQITTVEFYLGDDPDIYVEKSEYFALQIDEYYAQLILANPQVLLSPVSASSLIKHTPKERRAWIRDRGRSPGGADNAFKEYRKHPSYDGTKQRNFRSECRELWGLMEGRPPSKKS